MKRAIFLALPLLTFFLSCTEIYARSGCCSHHGGVCGCGCCDGSPLSNTCAPYYPECSRPVYIAPVATRKPIVYTPRPATPAPTISPTRARVSTTNTDASVLGQSIANSTDDKSWITPFILSGGFLGWLVLKILKKI